MMNAAIQENRKLILTSSNSPMTCRLQVIEGKMTGHCGLGHWRSCWELIGPICGKGSKSFLQILSPGVRSLLSGPEGKQPGGHSTLGLRSRSIT